MLKKFSWFLLILFIEGAALMAVELIGAKLIAPFYGSSLYVWTSVLGCTVSGLTLGYFFGGRLASWQPSGKALFIILGIAALLVMLMPFTSSAFIAGTASLSLLQGIFTTCFFLLVPPMFCFGLVGPLVSRFVALRSATDGRVAGSAYFISTLGGICAAFLFGFYLIPFAGLKMCCWLTGGALAALLLLYLFRAQLFPTIAAEDKPQAIPTPAKQPKQAKPIAVPAAGNVIQTTIYLYAIAEGGLVMAAELLAARMLAPFFGSSLDVWTTVMAFTLLGLAIGYFLGGYINEKYAMPATLWWVLLGAAVCISLMHIEAQHLPVYFDTLSFKSAMILVSFVLVVPPLVFLGMVPTMLIRYVASKSVEVGSVTGRVFTISSASGIASLFLMGFVIIPGYGLSNPSIAIAFFAGLYPFIKLISGRKYLALVLPLFFVVSLIGKKGPYTGTDIEVKYYSEGLMGQVMVADINKYENHAANDRMLLVNRIGEAQINRTTGFTEWDYPVFVTCLCSKMPAKSDVLMLGLGGGQIPNILNRNLDFNVDVVELDQRVVDVAQDYFFLSRNVNVEVDDARHYLETTKKKYDIIIIDVFHGDIAPPHMMSVESFKKAHSLLRKNGFIVVNFYGFLNGAIGKPGRSLYKTMLAANLTTQLIPTNRVEEFANSLFIGSDTIQAFSNLRSPLKQFGKAVDLDTLFKDTRNIDLNDAVLFTDDKTALDFLNIEGAIEWRKSYYDLTKHFMKIGVPLFE